MKSELVHQSANKTKEKRKPFISRTAIEGLKDFSLALPALILLALFTYYPLIYSLYLSFTDWNFIKPVKKIVGFKNYEWLFNNDMFYHSLKVTSLYTIFDVTLTLFFGLIFALVLDKTARAFSFMRTVIFMPHYISMVIAAIVFVWIFNSQYGVLNQALKFVGLSPVEWLTNPKTALWAVVIVSLWKGAGYSMIIFLSGLRSIPKEYYEAAGIDGANRWNCFRHITLPLLSPVTLFLVITQTIGSMKVFQSVDIMTGGGPLEATNVIVMWIYRMAFSEFRIGRASALVVVFFILLVLLTIIQMQVSKKKVHYER